MTCALTKDSVGIWLGTAAVDSGHQNLAGDYKANALFKK